MQVLRVRDLDLTHIPVGKRIRVNVEIVADGLGQDVLVPLLVARGKRPGPVIGVTAAMHGNELNGIPAIHRLFDLLGGHPVKGTVVGVLALNVPGLHLHQREFSDGTDLNDIMPGRPDGNVAEVYAHRVFERIIKRFDYLIDLHTASFGRINSLYVRADMTDRPTARMAYLQRPQIILHNPPADGTLRGAAMAAGIAAITVEIADPNRFQPNYVRNTVAGLSAVLADRGVLKKRSRRPLEEAPVLCDSSRWLYTDRGGLLEVLPRLTQRVHAGQTIARLRTAFGDVIREYTAPSDGIVIGKSINPVGQTGARILHLGHVADPGSEAYVRLSDAKQPLPGESDIAE